MAVLNRQAPFGLAQKGYELEFDPERSLFRLAFRAMGTRCGALIAADDVGVAERFAAEAVAWVGRFEGKYSRFLDTSLLSAINRAAGRDWVEIDPETERLLAICADMHFSTGGLLDPTSGPLVSLWNWKEPRSRLPSEAEIEAAQELVGWGKLERRPGAVFLPRRGMSLDFGGFGKEYAVDKVTELALACGVEACLVDFGQDIRVAGLPPDAPAWHVGLEDPLRPGCVRASLALQEERGVATSGDTHRSFSLNGRRYGHIVDPRTGRPVVASAHSVSVVAPSCLEAGALSTAAFMAGVEEGMALVEAHYGAEACFILEGTIVQTSRFHEYMVNG